MTGDPRDLRAGIIGTGFMGGVHAHAVRALGTRLECVAGSSEAKALDAAHRFGARRAVGTAELLADPAVDVVHVCTPNSTHTELALQALAAGKAVVCEKPLATSVADAEELVLAAESAEVTAAVPFVYRYYPTVHEIRTRIARGEGGRLWLLHGSYLQDWLSRPSDSNWRVDPALGGTSRAFADIGVHWCDLMEFATGHRIVRVAARLVRAYDERGTSGDIPVGTEDGASVMFETDQGASGQVLVSQVSPGRKNRLWFSFDGTAASFEFNQESPETVWVGGYGENRVISRAAETLTSGPAGELSRLPGGHPQGYQDCFNAFVGDVYASVAGDKRDTMPTFRDGLRAAVLTDAVVRSAAASNWIEVAS